MSRLSEPVLRFARPTLAVAPEDSLHRAAAALRDNGTDLLPLVIDEKLRGAVTLAGLALALGEGREVGDAAETVSIEPPTIFGHASAAEALRALETTSTLVVIDADRRVLGVLTAADLYPRPLPRPRPAQIGGMATPFGVYLTNGVVSGGVPKWALAVTGAMMFTLLFIGDQVAMALAPALTGVSDSVASNLLTATSIFIFLVGLRLIPMSGVHGAEHMVVHAMEREEELKPEIVRRMPRVHPRCGTNIAAGASLFLGFFGASWIKEPELRLLVAALVTVMLWRPFGSFLQSYFTTRRPTDRQLASGIRAGEMLLEAHARSPRAKGSIPIRIWNSGMLQVMAGSFAAYGIVYGISKLFKVDLGV
ncbi:DUF1385 domain-containing protein [bacterium]|nr:MAG: DUF1385 domain-containing protein [bacterium]